MSLTSENRVLLHQSICEYLELNGFLKSLKKFRSEADVEKDSWKNCLLNMEKMCQEHLKMRNDTNGKVVDTQQKDIGVNHVASMEIADDGKKSEATLENGKVNIDNVKSKKKKKSKSTNGTSDHVNGETHSKDLERPVQDTLGVPSEPVKKSKDKKKKKHKHESEPSDNDDQKVELAAETISEKAEGVCQSTKEDKNEAGIEKKSSKKRKKSSSDDNGTGEETPFDDTKRRKTDDSDRPNGTEQATETPTGFANGVSEIDREKSKKQDKTKEYNSSAEPRSANAFRRVKPDEVNFADERLQNNSYWAKEGAESGYGAKAEEVLGQVRGKDFRHEKTKKKRGSYRGGQIDLQSHSVKFNYDDDDE